MSSVIDPELTRDRVSAPRAKTSVLVVSVVATVVVAAWALIAPTNAEATLGSVVGWIANWFGWFYILLATAILVFVVYVGMRYRRIRLGDDDDRPE